MTPTDLQCRIIADGARCPAPGRYFVTVADCAVCRHEDGFLFCVGGHRMCDEHAAAMRTGRRRFAYADDPGRVVVTRIVAPIPPALEVAHAHA